MTQQRKTNSKKVIQEKEKRLKVKVEKANKIIQKSKHIQKGESNKIQKNPQKQQKQKSTLQKEQSNNKIEFSIKKKDKIEQTNLKKGGQMKKKGIHKTFTFGSKIQDEKQKNNNSQPKKNAGKKIKPCQTAKFKQQSTSNNKNNKNNKKENPIKKNKEDSENQDEEFIQSQNLDKIVRSISFGVFNSENNLDNSTKQEENCPTPQNKSENLGLLVLGQSPSFSFLPSDIGQQSEEFKVPQTPNFENRRITRRQSSLFIEHCSPNFGGNIKKFTF